MSALMNTIGLDILILDPKCDVAYAHEGDGAFDLRARIETAVSILPGERRTISTGIIVAIPQGYAGLVTPRSGLAHKQGLTVLNSPGLIDSKYRGEVGAILINEGDAPIAIEPYERIAQFMIVPAYTAKFNFKSSVEELGVTTRGVGGFGSTGVK